MGSIKRYLLKKFSWYIGTMFVAIIINFFIPRLMPGNVLAVILSRFAEIPGGQQQVEIFTKKFGLDQPIQNQLYLYITNLLRGDLGPSYAYYPFPVSDIIMNALPWTIGLLGVTTILSWILGNLLGTLVGWKRNSKISSAILVVSLCLNQVPYYILGILLVFLLSFTFKLFPNSGGYSIYNIGNKLTLAYVIDVLYHATLPALSIMLSSLGMWIIYMRSSIVSILGSDYLRFAKIKGLKKNVILMKYAFRNALLPQITGLAMSLGFIMSGSLICEIIFSYPGIGMVFFQAMNSRDYNLMLGVLIFTTFAVLTANLIVDLMYPLIDPRIRTGEG